MQCDGPKTEDRSAIPIGVFWDIENCQVPRGKSALVLANHIRALFFEGHREAEFLCVCDIRKEHPQVVHELHDAQVTVVHIDATSKNAADDKLKQCMRRYVDVHGSPATILLISGDVNFSMELSDFRHRQKIRVLLLHSVPAAEALLVCAHEYYSFAEVASAVPSRTQMSKRSQNRECRLVVQELPTDKEYSLVRQRLKLLVNNCGGRVLSIVRDRAYLDFPNPEAALRASQYMDGKDVCGSVIAVSLHATRWRPSQGLREGGRRDCSSSRSHSPESSSVEADSAWRGPLPAVLNTSLSSSCSRWIEENLWNLASFAAQVEQAGHSQVALGVPESLSMGLFVHCSSQVGLPSQGSFPAQGSASPPVSAPWIPLLSIVSAEVEVAAKPLRCALQHPSPPSSSSSSGFSSTSSSSSTLPPAVPSGESSRGWAQWADVPLPSVCVPRARFAAHVERLLDTHSGSLPLDSLQSFYEAEFGPLPLAPRLEPWLEGCVPLEHLVASLPGVTVVMSAQGFKRVVRESLEDPLSHGSPRLPTPKLEELSREVVALVCRQQQCLLPVHEFLPAFQEHFGRPCCLADYGCTWLVDLLVAIGHVVEILGQGPMRLVTLTHDAQLGRFAVDMKAVLEDPSSPHTLLLSSLPQRYLDVHWKPLQVADYGACCLDDLLRSLPRSMVLVEQRAGVTLLRLPERGPTEEEAGRLRELASELVQLLSEKGELLLTQLSRAYQQKYGKELRTSHYGPFPRLHVLLESIPEVVEVYIARNGRTVRLASACQPTKRAPLQETLTMVPSAAGHPEDLLQEVYTARNGRTVRLASACQPTERAPLQETPTVGPSAPGHPEDLLQELPRPPSTPLSSPVVLDVAELSMLDIISKSGNSLDLGNLWNAVHARCGSYPELSVLRKLEDRGQVTIDRQLSCVSLSPLALLARQMRQLLRDSDDDDTVTGGCLSLSQLEEAYKQKHGTLPALRELGFTSLGELLSSLPEYFALSGTLEAQTVSLADVSKRVGLLPDPNGLESVYSKPKTSAEPSSGTVAPQPVSPRPVTGRAAPQFSELVDGITAVEPVFSHPAAKNAAVQPVSLKPAAESAATQTVSSELLSGGATVTRPVSSEPVDERVVALPVNPVPVVGSAVSSELVTCEAYRLEVTEEAELLDLLVLLPDSLLDEPIPSGVPSPEILPELSPVGVAVVAAAADLMRFDCADQGDGSNLVMDLERIAKPSTSSPPAAQPASEAMFRYLGPTLAALAMGRHCQRDVVGAF